MPQLRQHIENRLVASTEFQPVYVQLSLYRHQQRRLAERVFQRVRYTFIPIMGVRKGNRSETSEIPINGKRKGSNSKEVYARISKMAYIFR